MAQGESDRRCTVRSGGGKWILKFVDSPFVALGAPGVGVRAMNFFDSLAFHEGDRTVGHSEIRVSG
jgi:hypothetical protein